MRKVLGFIGCIVLAGSLFALDYWQGHNNKLTSEQLKQDNAEIQQLLNEKSQLEKKLEETAQQETTQETQEISGAVLCFHSLDESFYTEIYPVVKEKVDSGILILEDGKLPGDNDYISAQAFSELIEDGWDCAVSIERTADASQWQTNIKNYLNALSARVSAKPTVYYFPSGGCSESDAQILKSLGFETVLCHEETTEKTIGGLNLVQLYGYNDSAAVNNVLANPGNCGLEIWVNWDNSIRTRVRYTETALQRLLNSSTITFKGLEELLDEDQVVTSQTVEERLTEIDQLLDDLYH
ncbi:hypothetical protein [Butyricicoccus porcorum]|uniref:hypothetical protein n=1 Tax=Butyricicoccus porcorum TaxID=1945634 RepID=UPI0030425698|nr:hypothetical protein [Lachnospiraceae bacterium]